MNIGIVSPTGYVHSQAFNDAALALQGALTDLGYQSCLVPASEAALVLGANLLPWDRSLTICRDAVVMNLEVHGTTWMGDPYLDILRQHEVWDYSPENANWLREQGCPNVKVCRLGYHPCLTRIEPAEQDIDVLFYGSQTPRRVELINGMIADGIKVYCLFGNYGAERDALIARSKIILNLHAYEHSPNEWARLQLLFANRACVFSEGGYRYDEDGIYLPRQFSGVIKWMLANPEARANCVKADHEWFKGQPQTKFVAEALDLQCDK